VNSPVTPLSPTRLVTLYALFAGIAILANIGLQKLFLMVYPGPFAVPLSVFFGTGGGLVVKFLLDKVWIFRYQHRDLSHGIKSFMLYTVMGLVTTAVFWGFEFGADAIFHTEAARFIGGAIGLAIGYVVKYRLDKKYVFA
jgi:putative flippase GtrA